MKRLLKKLRTPAGIALSVCLLLVMVGLGAIYGASTAAGIIGSLLMGMPLLGTALAADRETQQKESAVKTYLVKASTTVYKGGLVGTDSNGYALPAADASGMKVVGVAMETVVQTASSTSKVRVSSDRLFLLNASSITQAMVGQVMYVVDDNTFDDALGTNGIKAGQLAEYVSATLGWLYIPPGGIGVGAVLTNAGGTYTSAEQNLINELKTKLNTYLHLWPIFVLFGGTLAVGGYSALLPIAPMLCFGMIVNSDTLAAIRTDFEAIFLESYQGYTARWEEMATPFPANSQFLDLSWIGEVPAMKQWVDMKVLEGLRRFRYAIENVDWEATIEVDRNSIEDDQMGIYRPRIQGLAQEGKRHPDDLLSVLLDTGHTGLAFDGSAFFYASRVVGDSGTINNIVSGTGSTQAQFAADLTSALALMRGFKNDRGKPYNPSLDQLLVVVPPALEIPAKQTLNAAIITQTTNIFVGLANLWVNPYLGAVASHTKAWYLLNVGGPIKPLALSQRKLPQFVSLDNPNSDTVFKQRKYLYGVEGRYNAGYLLPWSAVKVDNA
jgi:phage major head subunit gpT-like protein